MSIQSSRLLAPGTDARPAVERGRASEGAASLVLALLVCACGGSSSGSGGTAAPPTNLSYPAGKVLLEIGEELEALVPSVTGTVSAWSIAPPLPGGLVLSPATGSISGTPTESAPRTLYTIQAANAAGAAQTTLDLHVLGSPRFLLVANANPQDPDDSTVSRLSLEQPGRLRHAGFQALTDLQLQPEAIVLHPSGLFVYLAHTQFPFVSVHVVDPGSGDISSGINVAAGDPPHSLAIHPEGTFLYVGGILQPKDPPTRFIIRTFAIEPTTGVLTFVDHLDGIPDGLSQLLIDPKGGFLVSLHASESLLQVLPLDAASGLPSVGDAENLQGTTPVHASFDPSGDRLYVALTLDPGFNVITSYPVTSPEGELGMPQVRQVDDVPSWTAVHPEGTFLYVLRSGSEDVRRFRIDPKTGDLELDADEGEAPSGSRLFIDERGIRAWLIDASAKELVALDLDLDSGALSETHRVRTRADPRDLVLLRGAAPLTRIARQVYTANSLDGTLSTLDVEASGALSSNTADVPAGTSPRDVALDPRQRWAFALSADEIRTFQIQSNGTLQDTGLFVQTGSQPTAIEVDPSGRFLFLIDAGDDLLTPYEIQPDGALVAGSAVSTHPLPRSLRVDPTGRFLLLGTDGLAPNGADGAIRPYPIDPLTGTLGAAGASAAAPGMPARLRFAQEADRVYVTLAGSNILVLYLLDATSGVPTPIQDAATPTAPATQPRDVILTPDGRFGFVALRNTGNPGRINAYDVRESDGALWNEQDPSATDPSKQSFVTPHSSHPIRLAVSPDGTRLYVLNEGLNLISVLNIGPDGLLSAEIPPAFTGNMPLDMELRTILD